MKIIFIAGYPFKGQPNKNIFNRRAAQSLSKFAEISVVNIRMWRPGRPIRADFLDGAVRVHHMCVPHWPYAKGWGYNWSVFTLEKCLNYYLQEELASADIVHSVGASNNGLVGGLLAQRHGLPHVLQTIGSDVNADLPQLKNLRLVRSANKRVSAVVCNSEALLRAYEVLYPGSSHAQVIYRGVSLSTFRNSPFPELGDFHFLFLGGLPAYKGTTHGVNTKGGIDLMTAWKEREEALQRCNAKLRFGGPSSLQARAHEWRSSLRFPDQVDLIGTLSPKEVSRFYRESCVVLVPSRQEGLPNVILESNASGRCVIASSAGGIPEAVINNRTGFLFRSGSVKELGDALVKAVSNPGLCREMGQNAREFVGLKFDSSSFARKYLEVYKRVLSHEPIPK